MAIVRSARVGKKSGSAGLGQHPLVDSLRPDPAKPPQAVIELVGLPGNSAKAGYQRLYLTAALDYYAEFPAGDILYSTTLPIEQSPFPGHQAMLLNIRREGTVEYTRTRNIRPVDEFDLDVRLGAPSTASFEMMQRGSDFTSCTGCSLGVSCGICPSRGCRPPPTRTCPK